jgi:transcription termination factor Rho
MSESETIARGVLELHSEGFGYLRDPARGYKVRSTDPFLPESLARRLRLRPGVVVEAVVSADAAGQAPTIREVRTVEGRDPREASEIRQFEDLTAIDPTQPIRLETKGGPAGMRVLDLLTPVGKGQRGLIVAPPRTGKTVLIQQIAAAVAENHPEIELVVLLVDERPEEVTEMRRTVKGQVVASSNDQDPDEHVRITELTFDRAKRAVEAGGDVLILMDSLTRLARAYNKFSATGRTLTGGIDIKALDTPKRLFGAARAFEEGGSLTVLASCLVETGSKMDDVIFQEFKGTGNLEIVLDRKMADRRVYPALDIPQSGTRKEERLLGKEAMGAVVALRRTLGTMKPEEAVEKLVEQMGKFATNEALLERIGQGKR